MGRAGSGSGTDSIKVTLELGKTSPPDNGEKIFGLFFVNLIQKCVQLFLRHVFPVFAVAGSFQRKAGKVIHFNVITVLSHEM
jgi:hypothetical protein